jgi:ubiquinol-cytochrome c reductase subunit 7
MSLMEKAAVVGLQVFTFFGKAYQKSVHNSLRKYGLRYEDLFIKEQADVARALKYLPKEEKVARDRRIKRAMMLSCRHEYLPENVQALQEPGKWYMKDLMEEFKVLREERDSLNNF